AGLLAAWLPAAKAAAVDPILALQEEESMKRVFNKQVLKKFFLFLSLAAVGFLFLGTGVFLYAKSVESPEVYETGKPFFTDIVLKTVATGKIIPRLEVNIKSQVSGVVETIFVRPGDLVNEGDLL